MQAVTLDVKTVARQRGAEKPRHPLLPPALLAFTNYWMNHRDQHLPRWSAFHLIDVQALAPYITIFKCRGDQEFEVEFMGSAVSTMVGEDMTGMRFTAMTATVAEIDWFERCLSALEKQDVQAFLGSANPMYTSRIDYVGGDFPFVDDSGRDVSRIVTLTVGRAN